MSPTSGNGSFQTVMDPGLYWIGFLVVTAGTTVPIRTLQGPNGIMQNTSVTAGTVGAMTAATVPNGWKLTGQGTTAMPTSFPTGAVATGSAPYVGFQVNINITN